MTSSTPKAETPKAQASKAQASKAEASKPKPAPGKKIVSHKPSKLAGRPGGVLWLMSNELRLFWRRGRLGPKTGLIMLAFLLILYSTLMFFLFLDVGRNIPAPPLPHDKIGALILTGIDLLIAFIGTVMVSGAVLAAVEAIYTRNDLDLLLSSPLSPWTVLLVRSAAIALGALPLYAGFIVPPVIWMSVFSSPMWVLAIPALIALAFAATGVSLLIVAGLFRLIGPKRTRVLAQVLSAVIGVSFAIGVQYWNLVARPRDGAGTNSQIVEWLRHLDLNADALWLYPARAVTADLPILLLWIAVCGAIFLIGVFLFSVRFIADAAAASSMGQRKQAAADGRIAIVRSGAIASMVRKEFRLLRRDPVLLSQIGLPLAYIGVVFIFAAIRIANNQSLVVQALPPALTVLSSTLTSSLIWITVSAEDAPDLIASAPVPTQLIERGKIIAAIAPVVVLLAMPALVLLVMRPLIGAWAILGVAVAGTCSAFIGLWRRTPGSRRNFIRRRQQGSVISSMGQAFVSLGLAGTIGCLSYGVPWIALPVGIVTLALFGALYKPPAERLNPA